jgi:hypothetical protein
MIKILKEGNQRKNLHCVYDNFCHCISFGSRSANQSGSDRISNWIQPDPDPQHCNEDSKTLPYPTQVRAIISRINFSASRPVHEVPYRTVEFVSSSLMTSAILPYIKLTVKCRSPVPVPYIYVPTPTSPPPSYFWLVTTYFFSLRRHNTKPKSKSARLCPLVAWCGGGGGGGG